MKTFIVSLTTAAVAVAGFPTVGPDYDRPSVSTPPAFRDVSAVTAVGADPLLAVDWWRTFDDPQLDALITRALAANQDLRAAIARVEQARAVAGFARSSYLPSLAAEASLTREHASQSLPNSLPTEPASTHRLSLDLSWELDLFGRVRRLNQGARADLDAAGATLAGVRLALIAEVATTHLTRVALEHELAIVTETIAFRHDAWHLMQARVRQGTADDVALARAETELAVAEADAAALAIRRAAAEHALAVLMGEPAPAFVDPTDRLLHAVDRLAMAPPSIPAGLPGDLLTRRPDLAVAERQLAAASARIGVAQAAFFPSLTLTGAAGYASAEINDLVKPDSRLWSLGPSLYLPLFQGGRLRSNLARTRAVYEEAAARYQQTALVALREVQDALTASRLLADQAEAQARAVASARRSAELSQRRYDAGFVSYFEVVDAQRTALAVERAAAQIAGQRWITHIALIKALGGGWSQPAPTASKRSIHEMAAK